MALAVPVPVCLMLGGYPLGHPVGLPVGGHPLGPPVGPAFKVPMGVAPQWEGQMYLPPHLPDNQPPDLPIELLQCWCG
jgi:hypothetical protein